MPDFFGAATVTADPVAVIVLRLIVAMVFGGVVAFVYRRARRVPGGSFTTTLILLAILIAMVTQVIGDNVARAFSLVGALSIVRFRTVVRDTQDTAYVIFSVAVGMAVGAATLLAGQMILELKFRDAMPAVFRELADHFALVPGRSSKYRVAADTLGIARLASEEGAPSTLHA